jgi:phospholipid transport system transporter-binding protein
MIAMNGACGTVSGPVTLDNVGTVLEEGNRMFTMPKVTVDLAGVTDVDSTAVSLLLEWRRSVLRDKRAIDYVNYPENLKSLIELYGVSELLVAE